MKIKLRRTFSWTWDNVTTYELHRGEYEVGKDIDKKSAELAIQFGAGVIVREPKSEPVVEKVAPENKVVKAKETKSKAKKAK